MRSQDSERFLDESGDEAGTAPGDRKFRPDVEGMRAIAIVLVLLLHFAIWRFQGGFIGVDVFFVISGFVITGVLLRERESTGQTSLQSFYARRARRIIPLVSLIVVLTVICERIFVGIAAAKTIAGQDPWISLFVFNFTRASDIDIIYFPGRSVFFVWSLAVEEQFYLVYPALLILLGVIVSRWTWHRKLNVLLTCIVVASFLWSVLATQSIVWLYVSPFTRAWELAVGGLIAVNAEHFFAIPKKIATSMTWVGLGMVLILSCTIKQDMPYPGWWTGLPVAGTALVIIGGTRAPPWGAEGILKLTPVKWLGRWSYGMYLWEIPVLVVSVHWHSSITQFPVWIRVGLLLVCVLLAAASYSIYEMPIRHSDRLKSSAALTLVCAVAFVAVSLVTVSLVAR